MKNSLKEYRLRTGLTQVQVAKKAGTSPRSYQRYEATEGSSQYSEPSIKIAIRIAKALDTTVEKIWGQPAENIQIRAGLSDKPSR